ncbi:MAG: hypothetical protein QJR03_05775 [Sphaerobacter sp.]|nr:hypothetical protein [Sphaerobacter sp.]
MRRRVIHLLAALGLLAGMLAGVVGSASAAPENPGANWRDPEGGAIFFPWVPNNDTLAGGEGVTGSVTVQNLEGFPVDVTISDAAGNELASLTLNPRASQTFEADDLGLPEPGAGVIASARWDEDLDLLSITGLCEPRNYTVGRGSGSGTVDTAGFFGWMRPYDVEVTQGGFAFFEGDDYTWDYNEDTGQLAIDWSPSGAEPSPGTDYEVVAYLCFPPRIAGLEKHTAGTVGARTSDDTIAVDGYSAVPWFDLLLATGIASLDSGEPVEAYLEGQSRWVLPIVQTNNGWDTELVITNVSDEHTSVSATFYAEGGQGFAGPSVAILSGETLKPGESVAVDLLDDAGFPEDAVGSVWVDATHAVVAAAFRVKPSTDMLLTNLAQPRNDAPLPFLQPTEKFGPLVFRDYNGWNTGINIANLSSDYNHVTVTYYNYAGNVVSAETKNIPPRAMEYVYTPATGNVGLGENQVTAVQVDGTHPLVAAIDEVKYLGGQGQGHAMSYPAAGALLSLPAGDQNDVFPPPTFSDGRYFYLASLALPLVQKGNPSTGMGDTSGINLFNIGPERGVEAWVQFVDSAGVPVAPTVGNDDSEAPIVLPLAAHAGATIYTLRYSEMPEGFQGAAVVGVTCGPLTSECVGGELVGVSNNVNYDVAGDGSAVYNMVNTYYLRYLVGIGSIVD